MTLSAAMTCAERFVGKPRSVCWFLNLLDLVFVYSGISACVDRRLRRYGRRKISDFLPTSGAGLYCVVTSFSKFLVLFCAQAHFKMFILFAGMVWEIRHRAQGQRLQRAGYVYSTPYKAKRNKNQREKQRRDGVRLREL